MDKFQLIAIKTGPDGKSNRSFLSTSTEGVEIDYLKNLSPNTVYQFNYSYKFLDNRLESVEYDSEKEIDLYTLKLSNGMEIPVNISAIVGENGSGKSALIELLYWINYNLGCQIKMLFQDGEEPYLPNTLNLELLYAVGDDYFLLKILETDSQLFKFKQGQNPCRDGEYISEKEILKNFFYSIVVNYSQYALNAKEVGEWVNPLFHKNDGYQTPIVLNPKRENGNIDINKEKKLLSRRLQSNMLESIGTQDVSDSIRNLANGKIATHFRVKYDSDYFKIKNEDIPLYKLETTLSHVQKRVGEKMYIGNEKLVKEVIATCYERKWEDNTLVIDGLVESIKKHFGPIEMNDIDFFNDTIRYISRKLVKMTEQYDIYSHFYSDNGKINNLDGFIEKIKTEQSHTAFKVKGAIMHLKYFKEIYHNQNLNGQGEMSPTKMGTEFFINIEQFSRLITELEVRDNIILNNYMMAFPPFFKVEVIPAIIPDNKECTPLQLSINDFSSGEKQRINSLSSIVYHLINLNSVSNNNEYYIKYPYINIILDEIEMYYHPEWQRTYVADMLGYLSRINPDNMHDIRGINIIFVTHSPFILSDIPHTHIIRMCQGKAKNRDESRTFGANIHDLLRNDFFMKEKGFMGEYAKEKIRQIIDYLDKGEETQAVSPDFNIGEFINLIGEPLIRNSLRDMFFKKDPRYLQLEIDRLTKLKESLNK